MSKPTQEFGIEQVFETPGEMLEEGYAEASRRLMESATMRAEARSKDDELWRLQVNGDVEAAQREAFNMHKAQSQEFNHEPPLRRPLSRLDPQGDAMPSAVPTFFNISAVEARPPFMERVKHEEKYAHAYAYGTGFKVFATSPLVGYHTTWANAGVGGLWRIRQPCVISYSAVFDLTTNWATRCNHAFAHSEGWIGLLAIAYDPNLKLQGYPVWEQQWLWDDTSNWGGAGGGHYRSNYRQVVRSGAFQPKVGWFYSLIAWGGIEISAAGEAGTFWSTSSAVIEATIPSMTIIKMTF